MQIVIEQSFFLNFFVNAMIVKCVGKMYKTKPKFWILASTISAIIAVILPYFDLNIVAKTAIIVLLSFAILFCCFDTKNKKTFACITLSFYGMTMLFGGACLLIVQNFGYMPLTAVFGVCTVVYLLACLVIRHNNKIKTLSTFVYNVEIDANERHIVTQGFLDSGNMLYDPIDKKPIVLIDYDVFSKLYDNVSLMKVMLKSVELDKIEKGHYIKVNSISSAASILVFNARRLTLKNGEEEKKFDNVCLGLSLSGFEKSLGKNVLLHSEFAC